jgi:hypothetical protein
MTWTVLWSLAATTAIFTAAHSWPILGPVGIGTGDRALTGLFAITTILGGWGIQLLSKFREGTGPESTPQRIVAVCLGAAIGACAWWIGETLWVEPEAKALFPGLFDHVLQAPLLTSSRNPTLAGYLAFFATLFGLRRWWWQADSCRPDRFRIRSFLWSGVVAFFIPALFPFPQGLGVCWALAISAVVQLSSPWIAPKARDALAQAPAEGVIV